MIWFLNSKLDLNFLLRQGLSEPDFYGDLVYKLKKIVGSNNFSAQFIKIISHYNKIGYSIKAAMSVTFDLLILKIMFLFFKNTLKILKFR